jgi:DNA-binding LytR/AlgR family response regulator
VAVVTKSCYKFGMTPNRILVHISRSERRVLDPDDVYCLRAKGGKTEVRLRSRTPLIDVRPLGEVSPLFQPFGFVRIHREHTVNIAHVRLLRMQADGRDWELKLEPPVNRVLPIARDRLLTLRQALGESAG